MDTDDPPIPILSPELERIALGWIELLWELDGAARAEKLSSLLNQQPESNQGPLKNYLDQFFATEVDENFLVNTGRVRTDRWLGVCLGAYRIDSLIAHGGMSDVYLAERIDGEYQQQVAIKIIRDGIQLERVKQFQERFQIERQILARLQHSNIARLLDAGTTEDGTPYYVMEFIDGLTIDKYCQENALSITDIFQLVAKVCQALASAHQQLIIHRDIKPDNILVTTDGEPKLLDFGIAKILEENNDRNNNPTLQALTPAYASPEQIQQLPLGLATDIYSLGVVLYELLTQQLPYAKDKTTAPYLLAEQIVNCPPIPPSKSLSKKLNLGFGSGDVDGILLKALNKNPSNRYATSDSFAQDLTNFCLGLPVHARAPGMLYRSGKWVVRHKIATVALTLTTMLGSYALNNHYQQLRAIEQQYLQLIEQEEKIQLQNQRMAEQADALMEQEQTLLAEQARIAAINQQIIRQREQQQQARRALSSLDTENIQLKEQVDELVEHTEQRLTNISLSMEQNLSLLNEREWETSAAFDSTLKQQIQDIERIFVNTPTAQVRLLQIIVNMYQARGLWHRAIEVAKKTLATDTEIQARLSLLAQLAGLHLQLEQPSQAETYLQRALDLSSNSEAHSDRLPVLYAQLAIVHLQKSNAAKTSQYLDLIRLSPSGQWQRRAFAAQSAYNHTPLAALNHLTPDTPNTLEGQDALLAGNLNRQQGDREKARAWYQKAIYAYPDYSHWGNEVSKLAQLELADLDGLLSISQARRTVRQLSSQLGAQHSYTQRATLLLGNTLYRDGLYEEAEVHLKYLNLSANSEARYRYATVLSSQQKNHQAVELWNELNNQLPTSHRLTLLATLNKLIVSLSQGAEVPPNQWTKISDTITQNFAFDVEIQLTYLYLQAWREELGGNYAAAAERYQEALTLASDQPNTKITMSKIESVELKLGLARTWYYRERWRQSERVLEQIIEELDSSTHPLSLQATAMIVAIETQLDPNGRLRKVKAPFTQLFFDDSEELLEQRWQCYEATARVYAREHRFAVEYWYLFGQLYHDLSRNPNAFNNTFAAPNWSAQPGTTSIRRAVECIETLNQHSELDLASAVRHQILLALLYTELGQASAAQQLSIQAQRQLHLLYGPNHPLSLYLQKRIPTETL